MDAPNVVALLGRFGSAGLRAWIAGGWAVDAVVGHQTREHGDLDLAVDAAQLDEIVALLEAEKYTIETDWRPARLSMSTDTGLRVDLHPVRFATDGTGVQSSTDDATFFYAADGFSAGTIAGQAVPCLGVAQQLSFRAGYSPREVDRHDIELLESVARGSA